MEKVYLVCSPKPVIGYKERRDAEKLANHIKESSYQIEAEVIEVVIWNGYFDDSPKINDLMHEIVK